MASRESPAMPMSSANRPSTASSHILSSSFRRPFPNLHRRIKKELFNDLERATQRPKRGRKHPALNISLRGIE